jgi:hypothetical protein
VMSGQMVGGKFLFQLLNYQAPVTYSMFQLQVSYGPFS